jgi:hypothetical protein
MKYVLFRTESFVKNTFGVPVKILNISLFYRNSEMYDRKTNFPQRREKAIN